MDETILLINLACLMLVAGACTLIFSKLKLPSVIGFLAAGIIIGPILDLSDSSDMMSIVSIFSDLGIVILMFYIGLELNLQKLKKVGKYVIVVAAIQLPLVVMFGYIAGTAMGWSFTASIFLGAVLSGSSTAVVAAVLKANNVIDEETKDGIILITVMEDIGQVIILTMATPLLSGDSPALDSTLILIFSIILFIGLSVAVGVLVIPKFLNWVGKKYSPESLLIISIGLCFAMALCASSIGLSIAIGSFLMGLIISQCEYSKVVMARIEPLKEIFMAVFFISIGMEIVPAELVDNLLLIFIIVVIFILAKGFSATFACYVANRPLKTAFISAASLLAMGEFALIISKTAYDAGAVQSWFYTSVIGACLVSMLLLPPISKNSIKIYDKVSEASPSWLHKWVDKVNEIRADVFARVSFSPASKKIAARETSMIAIDFGVIIITEIIFYYLSPYAVQYVADTLPSLNRYVMLAILIANFIILIPVVHSLVQSLKAISKLMIVGGTISKITKTTEVTPLITFVQNMSTVISVTILTLLILIIVPISFGTWAYFAGLVICLIIVLVYVIYSKNNSYMKARTAVANTISERRSHASWSEDEYEEDQEGFVSDISTHEHEGFEDVAELPKNDDKPK